MYTWQDRNYNWVAMLQHIEKVQPSCRREASPNHAKIQRIDNCKTLIQQPSGVLKRWGVRKVRNRVYQTWAGTLQTYKRWDMKLTESKGWSGYFQEKCLRIKICCLLLSVATFLFQFPLQIPSQFQFYHHPFLRVLLHIIPFLCPLLLYIATLLSLAVCNYNCTQTMPTIKACTCAWGTPTAAAPMFVPAHSSYLSTRGPPSTFCNPSSHVCTFTLVSTPVHTCPRIFIHVFTGASKISKID